MAIQALFSSPDFYFTLIGLLESLALLSTSLLLFRCFTICISIGYVFLALWVGLASPGMKSILSGASLDIALNVFMIVSYFYARSIFSLQPGWRELYRLYFSTLLPFEFRRLLRLGDVVVVEQAAPRLIVASGDLFESLYFVVDVAADLVVDGRLSSARLQRGDWIAEFSMLTGKPASADVLATSLRLLSWKAEAISKLKVSMPAVFEKVNALIARNLCDKLVRANRTANQVLAEQSG